MKLRVGSKLLSIRDERRLSQAEMADLLDIPTSTYSRIERNETSLEVEKLAGFAETLGVSMHDLLPETIAMHSKINNSGFGGGIIFGNQYFYTNENDRVKQLVGEINILKSELDQLRDTAR